MKWIGRILLGALLVLSVSSIGLSQPTSPTATTSTVSISVERTSKYGTCWKGGEICVAPTASMFVGQVNLDSGDFTGGLIPGVGYGMTYKKNKFECGAAIYLSSDLTDDPKVIQSSLVLSIMEYVRIGAGFISTEHIGTNPIIQFGIGADFLK
jgi:hypothetical protein